VALFSAYCILQPWCHPLSGSFDETATPEGQSHLQRIFAEPILLSAPLAPQYVAEVLQLLMNSRARTFAGQSRAAVALLLLARLPKYAVHAGVFGQYPVLAGLSWDDALRDALLLGLTWQALTMQLVDQAAEDETEK
jgi:hypothetical protein